jgi:hypothetical protein
MMAANVMILPASEYLKIKEHLGASSAVAKIRTDMGTLGRIHAPEALVISVNGAPERIVIDKDLVPFHTRLSKLQEIFGVPYQRAAYVSDVRVVKTADPENAIPIRGCGSTRGKAIANYLDVLLEVKDETCLVVGKADPIRDGNNGKTRLRGNNLRYFQFE